MTCHFTPSVKAIAYSKGYEKYFSSQLLRIFCRLSWKSKSSPSRKWVLKYRGLLSLSWDAAAWGCSNPARHGSLVSSQGEMLSQCHHSSMCRSPGLSGQYLDSLTLMNCSLEFYTHISEFLVCFSAFFYSHRGVCLTFLQVGHCISDDLCVGKEDYFIAMNTLF